MTTTLSVGTGGFSLEGIIASVYLLDNTCFRVHVKPTTTAGSVASAVASVMGVTHDAHHSLFHLHASGDLLPIDDGALIATAVGDGTRWADQGALIL